MQPYAEPKYLDFSYSNTLAFKSTPLVKAKYAAAAMSLGLLYKSQEVQDEANRYYVESLALMRKEIEQGKCDGSEDWILATAVVLCLFEVRSIVTRSFDILRCHRTEDRTSTHTLLQFTSERSDECFDIGV